MFSLFAIDFLMFLTQKTNLNLGSPKHSYPNPNKRHKKISQFTLLYFEMFFIYNLNSHNE